MNTTFDHPSPTQGILTLHLEPQDYKVAWEQSLLAYRPQATIRGFRKGHAPLSAIKQTFGGELLSKSIFQVAERALFTYLQQHKIATLGAPLLTDYKASNLSPDHLTSCTLSYQIGLVPPFELPELSKIEVEAYEINGVEEETLEQIIEELRRSYATFQDAERAEVDHILQGTWYLDSQPLEPSYFVHLNREIEGLHPLFIAQEAGASVTLDRTEIESLHAVNPLPDVLQKSLEKGDNASFSFHIKMIYDRQLPPLGETFYTKVLGSPVQSKEAFRKQLTEVILSKDQARAQKILVHNLRQALLKAIDLPLPEESLKRWLQSRKEHPLTPEEVERDYPRLAEATRWDLMLEKFTELYHLEPSPQEVQAKLVTWLEASPNQEGATRAGAGELSQKAAKMLAEPSDNLGFTMARQIREERALKLIEGKVNLRRTSLSSKAFYQRLQGLQIPS